MNGEFSAETALPLQPCQVIMCILPDDGTDHSLLLALRQEKGITRTTSISCRGIAALRNARTTDDRLPEPSIVKMVNVIVEKDEATTLFDYIFEKANINRPGGGIIIMSQPITCTPFTLPEAIPPEKGLT